MNTQKSIMPPPNAFKLPPNVIERDEDGSGLPTVYLRSEGTEAFRVRLSPETRKVVASLRAAYAQLSGKSPSFSLLVRRALAAHLADTVAVLEGGSEAERRAHVAKLLGGQS
jgi:hypothetical protein